MSKLEAYWLSQPSKSNVAPRINDLNTGCWFSYKNTSLGVVAHFKGKLCVFSESFNYQHPYKVSWCYFPACNGPKKFTQ